MGRDCLSWPSCWIRLGVPVEGSGGNENESYDRLMASEGAVWCRVSGTLYGTSGSWFGTIKRQRDSDSTK